MTQQSINVSKYITVNHYGDDIIIREGGVKITIPKVDVKNFREAVAPIDDAMVDRALLAKLNAERVSMGMVPWKGWEEFEMELTQTSDIAEQQLVLERAWMRNALEAAYDR